MSRNLGYSGQWILKTTLWLFEQNSCANLKRRPEAGEVRAVPNQLKVKNFLSFMLRIPGFDSKAQGGSEKHSQYLNLINKLR